MYTLDYVKNNIGNFEEDDLFDSRFTKRLMSFLPTEEWEKYGYKYNGTDTFKPKEWTEENIINQLKSDVEFGIEKAVNHRGISASLMFDVVRAWCKVLENGLDKITYESCWYGDRLYIEVDKMYNFGLVNEDTFDDDFHENW